MMDSYAVTVWTLYLLATCWLTGCAGRDVQNPQFPLSVTDARDALRRMADERKPLARPVIVIGGYLDPGLAAQYVASRLKDATGDDRIYAFAAVGSDDFDDARRRFFAWLRTTVPDGLDEHYDVVGVSMGGLIARYAASGLPELNTDAEEDSQPGRLLMGRLFTISTPHRGAAMAGDESLHVLQRQMHAESEFLARLNAHEPMAGDTLVPYVRLNDAVVGVENAAPQGMYAWWLPNRPLQASHTQSFSDPRILADIARRLRGEITFTLPNPQAPPNH